MGNLADQGSTNHIRPALTLVGGATEASDMMGFYRIHFIIDNHSAKISIQRTPG